MKPRLYPANEVEFINNGLGPLSEAQSCTVEENRNGSFELAMDYPVTGELFGELKNGAIIMAKPNDTSDQQPFRIYNITTPLHGVVTAYARHISYQLSHIPVSPFVANSCTAALQGLKTHAAEACPFEFWTDKETVAAFSSQVPTSARSLLGGVAGSILDTFGGEYEFDRWTVKLHRQRGTDSGVVIAYGKNLTDLSQEKSIENTITGIYPYYCDASTGEVLELPEKVVSSPSAENYPYHRTIPLDCSSEWDEMPTVEQLRDYAARYVQREGIGVPHVSLKVSFWPLWQSEEFRDVAPVEKLALCDTATVRFTRLGVDAKAKVVATVYDVLAERYESITLGEAATNLADTIVKQEKQLQEVPDESNLEAAAARATNWITGNKGGYVLMRRNADGQPYELLIMDSDDITTAKKVWRFNQSGLGYSSTGYNGTYGLAMTQDGQIVADYITTGKLSANLVQAGVLQDKTGKVFKLDLDGGTLEADFNSLTIAGRTPEAIAQAQAKAAADAAQKAAEDKAAGDLERYKAAVQKTIDGLQDQIDGNITTWFYPYNPTTTNAPASTWTDEAQKEAHAGDLFFNTDTKNGKAYRWAKMGDEWGWLLIEDTDIAKALANAQKAQDTADGKRRVFITEPVPPYDVGDLWAQGADGELLACIKTRAAAGTFTKEDWTAAANYNEVAKAMLEDYAESVTEQLEGLEEQVDGKTETWFYPYDPTTTNAPASTWTDEAQKEAHAGDLFFNTAQNAGRFYHWTKTGDAWGWQPAEDKGVAGALQAAAQAQDTADGKRRVFTTEPVPPYDVGDLWAQGADGGLLACIGAKPTGEVFAAADWAEAAAYVDAVGAAVAGRNLVQNSTFSGLNNTRKDICIVSQAEGSIEFYNMADAALSWSVKISDFGLKNMRGQRVTVSYDYQIAEELQYVPYEEGSAFEPGTLGRLEVTFEDDKKQLIGAPTGKFDSLGKDEMADFARVSATGTVEDKPIKSAVFKVFAQHITGHIIFKKPKVELGPKATPWTAAPEDALQAATGERLTQEGVFNRLTNNGQLQGLYMADGKLYINAQYIATGKISSVDGNSYFDLDGGRAVLKGTFSTVENTNASGTYRVYFDAGRICCQKKNTAGGWEDAGFIQWNYGVTPPEPWVKAARIDATGSIDTPGLWLVNGGKTLWEENGQRCGSLNKLNGYTLSWAWDSAVNGWVLKGT